MNTLYVICGLGIASLVAELINLKRWLIPFIILGVAVATALALRDWNTSTHYFSDMVIFDNSAIAFSSLICVIALFWFWLANTYFHHETHVTDQAALVLFVIVGALVLASFNNMAMLFLGIEILSLSLYVLAGSRKESLLSNEASFKYFLMGSFATGFLLMGIALIYGATGFFHLDKISTFVYANQHALPGFFYVGILLVIVGMAFKVSAVPFHFWAPDVYEGSPTIITALMATVVKVGAFAALFRLLTFCFFQEREVWQMALEVLTVLTLVVANVTAVYQYNVKRMLAYSSVGHAGYLLLVLVAGSPASANTILYYLAAYSTATLTAFGVLSLVEQQGSGADTFNGLYKRSPFLAVVMTVALLSMAGIPPLSGFLAKYFVFALAIKQGYMSLVIVGVLASLVGVYYYFQVIVSMFFKEAVAGALSVPRSLAILLCVLVFLIALLGIFPGWLMVL